MVTEEIGALLGGVLIFLTLVNLVIMIYVAFSKLDEAENHLINCELVQYNRKVWGGGPWAECIALRKSAGGFSHPN